MKTKSFQEYLEKRLSKEEIAEIEEQAELEVRILKSIQKALSDAMSEYMKKRKVGFNELVRRLDYSPSQVAKIQKGEANLTVSSLAHILALLGKEPQDVFSKSKK
jgi:transcriptional regulator with XRE-family HTH domain